MEIYMHCLTNQDLTKQFAYTNEIRINFFDDSQDQEEISLIGIKSQKETKVRILTATDCRFNANFRYALFGEGNATIGDIVIFYKIGFRKYNLELIEKTNPRYSAYKELFSDPRHLPMFTNHEQLSNIDTPSSDSSPHTPEQIIYYGVPGCGKSFKVEEKIKKEIRNKSDQENQVMRVVFHPDYTNADFVGQIMPLVEDGIEYRFKAGPFSRILKHAYKEPNKKFFLVIEEINRGNAAAIFGDLFQLLDRDKNGFSSYSVTNTDITSFIMSDDDYHNDKNISNSITVGDTIWTLNTGIRIPPNLSILATMNTSDQNVFTLDNAFQRRWDMQYISNSISKEELKKEENKKLKTQYDTKIGSTNISWGIFRDAVNKKIASSEFSFSNAEDKQLGLFFIQPKKRDAQSNVAQTNTDELIINESDFSNKVLKYLWLDVFKRDREEIFKPKIHTFGDLVEKFKESKAFENCFNDEFIESLNRDSGSSPE